MLITFSGLDGSGKSTLISRLKEILEGEGHSVCVKTMYFHLSLYAQFRYLRDVLLGRERRSPQILSSTYNLIPNLEKPDVSDKAGFFGRLVYGVFRSRMLRRISLFGDLIVFFFYSFWEERMKGNILITDRYFYDSLADVVPQRNAHWRYVRFFLKLCPAPDLSVFVDVLPEVAYERKREYPLEYLKWRRETYQKIFGYLSNPLILDNENLEVAVHCLNMEVIKRAA